MSATLHDDDERRLAELGYKQDLKRGWSSFSNFAISFTIISVLAGCFTTYGQAWNNGGPIAISWGWPIICGLILLVAFSMSELASKFPTAGGIYYWASSLGGPRWGWFTGWFNLVGLVGVVASVDYAAATFLNATLNLYGLNFILDFSDGTKGILGETFVLFVLILTAHALINIFSSPLVALFNNISVGWHVFGVTVIVLILIFVPDKHQSLDFVFTDTINNSGFSQSMFWFYVLPLGFLLTMYTQTGYDASAHLSEETRGAALGAAKGVWKAVFWSGVGRLDRAAGDHVRGDRRRRGERGPRLVARGVQQLADAGGEQGGRPDRHDRAAVLRHGVRDELLADDVRVLARPARCPATACGRASTTTACRPTRCSARAPPR